MLSMRIRSVMRNLNFSIPQNYGTSVERDLYRKIYTHDIVYRNRMNLKLYEPLVHLRKKLEKGIENNS